MEAHASRTRLVTEAGLLAMAVIWGLNFVVVKWALDVFDPLGFNALRHLIASLFLTLVVMRTSGDQVPPRQDIGRIVTLGVIGHFLYQMLFVFGLQHTKAGNASLMLALVPLFILVLGGRRAERRPMAWMGAAVSLAGVALVSGSSLRIDGANNLLGDFMLFWAAGAWAVYTMAARPLIERYGPIRTTTWTLWIGSIGLFLFGIPSLLAQDWTRVTAAAWGSVLYSSLLSTGIAHLLWYRGVQILGGAHAAIMSNLAPLVALSAGAMVLGERLTAYSVIGAAMVIGGVVLVRQ